MIVINFDKLPNKQPTIIISKYKTCPSKVRNHCNMIINIIFYINPYSNIIVNLLKKERKKHNTKSNSNN